MAEYQEAALIIIRTFACCGALRLCSSLHRTPRTFHSQSNEGAGTQDGVRQAQAALSLSKGRRTEKHHALFITICLTTLTPLWYTDLACELYHK